MSAGSVLSTHGPYRSLAINRLLTLILGQPPSRSKEESPSTFLSRPSRGLRPKEPLRLQPHPSYAACPGRALSRAAWLWLAAAACGGRSYRRERGGGGVWLGGGAKMPCVLPSMLPLLSSPLEDFLSCILSALCHIAPIGLAASCGVGTSCRQRPSIRAGATTRHPILYASCDESWKTCGRRPHLSDGFWKDPEVQRAASTSTRSEA
jgi:hypothetical protein